MNEWSPAHHVCDANRDRHLAGRFSCSLLHFKCYANHSSFFWGGANLSAILHEHSIYSVSLFSSPPILTDFPHPSSTPAATSRLPHPSSAPSSSPPHLPSPSPTQIQGSPTPTTTPHALPSKFTHISATLLIRTEQPPVQLLGTFFAETAAHPA